MALITPEEYLTFIGSTDEPTAQLSVMCDAISSVVQDYIGRELEYRERVEYYSGTGNTSIVLRVRPVYEVSEVRLDSSGYFGLTGSFDDTTILNATSYALEINEHGSFSNTGRLFNLRGKWTLPLGYDSRFTLAYDHVPSIGNIKVTYTAGFNPIPPSIKLACVEIISRIKNSGYLKYGTGLEKEHLGDWSYTMGLDLLKSKPELGTQRQILSRYREVF